MRDFLGEGFWVPAGWRRRVGRGLAAFAALATALIVAQLWLHDSRREVVVELGVINDEEYVFVNCVKAAQVLAAHPDLSSPARTPIPLGWLHPEDRLTFEYFNASGDDVIPDFRATSNGVEFLDSRRGSEAFVEITAPVNRYAYVRTFTAAGDPIGSAGCQEESRIAEDARPYIRLRDDLPVEGGPVTDATVRKPAALTAEPESLEFSPDRRFDAIDDWAPIVAVLLASMGLLLAIPIAFAELRLHGRGFLLGAIAAVAGALAIAQALPLGSDFQKALAIGAALYVAATVFYCRGRIPGTA